MYTAKDIGVVIESSSISCFDALAFFQSIVEKRSANKACIFESLGGPDSDGKQSIVAVNPLLEISCYESHVRISGHEQLVATISHLISQSFNVPEIGVVELTHAHDLWDVLRAIESLFSVSRDSADTGFSFGFICAISYEAMAAIEPSIGFANFDRRPMAEFRLYSDVVRWEESNATEAVHFQAVSRSWDSAGIDAVFVGLPGDFAESVLKSPDNFSVTGCTSKSDYLEKTERALEYVRSGDVYQVQIGHQLIVQGSIDPLSVYLNLRHRNPSPYMYYCMFSERTMFGASPELFLRIKDRELTMRPIAGTAVKSSDSVANEAIKRNLLSDEKELAEHLMLVDLSRNDMAKVCESGSVETDQLMFLESYSHVYHIVSNVKGRLLHCVDHYDAIQACFVAGTMTGAPKIRAMEIIGELENSERGIYSGVIGMIDFEGYASLALAIRCAEHFDSEYRIRASAGIVSHSDPEKEWKETLAKLGATYLSITGQEIDL